jgi:hypothetical protein
MLEGKAVIHGPFIGIKKIAFVDGNYIPHVFLLNQHGTYTCQSQVKYAPENE